MVCRNGVGVLVYLNLQQVVAPNALIVHLMVCIVSITTTLIFDERKPVLGSALILAEHQGA